MVMSRYDPFRDSLSLRHAMDRLFEQSFVSPHLLGESTVAAPMDVCETDQGYDVRVALPGVRPEDIDVMVHQNTLTVKGQYGSIDEPKSQISTQGKSQTPQQGTAQPSQVNWLVKEMQTGAFQRSITFDKPIDIDRVQTSYEQGILMLTLPFSQSIQPRHIAIKQGRSPS